MSVSKIIGFILVFSGCAGLGVWHSMQLKKRIKNIREMLRILDMLLSEINYGRSTLPECCEQIRDKTSSPYHEIFNKICNNVRSETGECFQKTSENIMKEELECLQLKKEKEIFCRCFSDIGYGDRWMVQQTIERGKRELQEILNEEETDMIKQSRLAVRLGVMSGILLILIFM